MNSLSTPSTYALLIRGSAGTAYAFTLNQAIGSAGQAAYETGLSSVTATEVYQ